MTQTISLAKAPIEDKKKEKRVVRIEATGKKHEKRPSSMGGGYGVPVIYHLEDGTTMEKSVPGRTLKAAKAYAEQLVENPGDRAIEFLPDGMYMERVTYG